MNYTESIDESNINESSEMNMTEPQESQNLETIGDEEVGSFNELIIKDKKTSTTTDGLEHTEKAIKALIEPTESLTEGGKGKKRTKKRRTKSKNLRKSRRRRRTIQEIILYFSLGQI
jgi:hypothetical protein